MSKLLMLLLLLMESQCRYWWTTNFLQISDVVLKKNNPLQLPKKHYRLLITGLEGRIYSDSLSQLEKVLQLEIIATNVTEIEDGALCSTSGIKHLELNFHNTLTLPNLTKNAFKNCNRLESLYLTFRDESDDYQFDNGVFEHLTNLKELFIGCYNITVLDKSFPKINSSLLTTLGFLSCGIQQIDSNFFEAFTNLENLAICDNKQLKEIPDDLFFNTSNLQKLILKNNGIQNLTWDEFRNLSKLQRLDVAKNRIRHFNAQKIAKNMPNLRKLAIELNPLPLEDKEDFADDLQDKMDHAIIVKCECDFIEPCDGQD